MAIRMVKAQSSTSAPGGGATTKTKTVKADAAPAKTKKTGPPVASKYIGRTTGMRVQAYQDKLMAQNVRAKLTDEALAKAMRDEFTGAAKFTTQHVKGIRSLFNHGKRASQEGVAPAKPVPEYAEDGTVIVRTRVVGKKKSDASKAGAAKAPKTAKARKSKDEDEEEETEE